MWLRLGGRAPCKEINKIIKGGMDVSRAFKGERVADTRWVFMMFEVMSQLQDILILSSLAMSKLVRGARRRRNKVSKVGIEGIVDKGNENVRAQARGGCFLSAMIVSNNGCRRLEGIEFIHPSGRLGMFVRQDVRDLRCRVATDAAPRSARKAITDRVVQKYVGIEMGAGSRMEAKGVPQLLT